MAKKKTAKGAETKGPATKQDAEAEERRPTLEDRFAEFSARYKWYVFVPILVGIVAVVVLTVHSETSKRQARNALEVFDAARTVADFDAVAKQYPRRFSGRMALVRAGELFFDQGKYAEARQRYQAYLDTDPDPLLAMPVWMALVQTYIAEKDYAKGVSTCDVVLAQPGNEYVRMQALYYKGYCYELNGDTELAMVEYGKVTSTDRQPGPWYEPAGRRLADLRREARAAEEAAGGPESGAGTMPELPGLGLDLNDG